jgi:hypothetical protein
LAIGWADLPPFGAAANLLNGTAGKSRHLPARFR